MTTSATQTRNIFNSLKFGKYNIFSAKYYIRLYYTMNKLAADLVKPKFSLKDTVKRNVFLEQIVTTVTPVVQHVVSSHDIKIIQYVAEIIENLVLPKHNIDKVGLLVDIFKRLFDGITDADIEVIKDHYNDLLQMGVIKKVSTSKLISSLGIGFLKKFVSL